MVRNTILSKNISSWKSKVVSIFIVPFTFLPKILFIFNVILPSKFRTVVKITDTNNPQTETK
jgi:hypothetical protein